MIDIADYLIKGLTISGEDIGGGLIGLNTKNPLDGNYLYAKHLKKKALETGTLQFYLNKDNPSEAAGLIAAKIGVLYDEYSLINKSPKLRSM